MYTAKEAEMKREFRYYEDKYHGYVTENWTTKLEYQPDRYAKMNGEPVQGWWVYTTDKRFKLEPSSKKMKPEQRKKYDDLFDKECKNCTVEVVARDEPYLSDAKLRREAAAEEGEQTVRKGKSTPKE